MSKYNSNKFYERIDQLIRMKSTGNPRKFAKRLEISESHLYRILNKLKVEANCPIIFKESYDSYCYDKQGKLIIKFQFEELNNDK